MKASAPKIAFLAADTLRSKAYAQELETGDIPLISSLIYGYSADNVRAGQSKNSESLQRIKSFDPFRPLDTSLSKNSKKLQRTSSANLNSSDIAKWVTETRADVIIFSGYGGDIAPKELLSASPPFLHCHFGWLPDYRGSTTLYYSWLKESFVGVSAILLSPEIDQGDILLKKRFPVPNQNQDPDYDYDCIIRAETLIEALKKLQRDGQFDRLEKQNTSTGNTYYVIHPVLKHIARLSNKKPQSAHAI